LIFEPQSVKRGINISYLSSWLLIVVVLGGFYMEWKTNKNNTKAVD